MTKAQFQETHNFADIPLKHVQILIHGFPLGDGGLVLVTVSLNGALSFNLYNRGRVIISLLILN